MTKNQTLDAALDLVKKNPHTGSRENIVTLSLEISLSKKTMDKSIYGFFKEKSNISPKIYSNLKKIGDTLLEIPEEEGKISWNGKGESNSWYLHLNQNRTMEKKKIN